MRKSLIAAAAATTVVAGLATAPMAGAADSYFLKINGISGDQTLGQVKDAIAVKSFQLGAENTTTIAGTTGGAAAGKTSFDKLEITKDVDATSPLLLNLIGLGKPIQGMELVAVRTGATGQPLIYQRYYLSPAFLTSDKQSGSGEGIEEDLEFAYGAMQMTNVKQAPTGATTNVTQSWNMITNSPVLQTPGQPSAGNGFLF